MRPHLTINRRYLRAQQLLSHVLRVIEPYIPEDSKNGLRDCARELEELFSITGAYIVTDADRAMAGLPMRDHNGLTLEELQIIEAKMMVAMIEPMPLPVASGRLVIDPTRHESQK